MNVMVRDTARPDNVPADRVVDFNIYDPPGGAADIHRAWRTLQEAGLPSLVWTPHNGGHWITLRGALVEEVLSDSDRFSSHTVLVPKDTAGEAYRLVPLSLDPPEHRPFRNLLNDSLSARALKPAEARIRALTIEIIEGFKAAGRCNFVEQFAEKLPLRIFMQIVDLPTEDMPRLKHLADQFTRPDGSLSYPEVAQLFRDYMAPIITARRGSGGTDMLSRMINGQVNDRALTDEEAANICIQVLVGGLDTVVNLMSFTMLFLGQNPGIRGELVADPSRIGNALNEVIRRFPVVASAREVKRDMCYEGAQLKAGDMVVAPTLLHGLDESENPDAFAFQIDRRAPRHSTFGKGSHTCPGATLARIELRILLEEWLGRIPDFRISPESEVTFSGGIVATVRPYELVWRS
jgi:cytochrome P450